MQTAAPADRPTFVAGVTLVAVTLLAVAAMAHHPTVAATPGVGQVIERIGALSRLSAIVHGALIASMLVTAYCLFAFASRRDLGRAPMQGGIMAYAAGVVVMIGAALVSGFVVGDVARLMPHDTPVDLQVARQLLIFCGIVNQACANCGAVLMSVGIGLWSIGLLRDRGVVRGIGALGGIVALVPIVGLPSGMLRLDVHGMLVVVLLQALWNLAVGGLMIRGDLRVASTA